MEAVAWKQESKFITPALFQHYTPSASLLVSVIVPVRNEEEHLVNTLEALRLQKDNFGNDIDPDSYEVLLLANNCSDFSFDIASTYQRKFPSFKLHPDKIELPDELANIGTVRCLLMDEACQRLLSIGNHNGIIASTDGDSEVDSTWIFHIIQEINRGNDAVGGRIVTKSYGGFQNKYYLQDELYRNLVARVESIADPQQHDPWPRHFQYFGASLAVTCKMYRQVGGLPQLPFLEDEAFYNALVREDAKIRKSMDVKVTTSDRHHGRVGVGFSQQLREWAGMEKLNKPQLVASAEELIAKFTNRHTLRQCWLSRTSSKENYLKMVDEIADVLFLKKEWLRGELKRSSYFGKLWEVVEALMYSGKWGELWKPATIDEAIKGLMLYSEVEL